MRKIHSMVKIYLPLILLLVGVVNFSLRNLNALTFPILYAEDGVWFGKLLVNGFWDTAIHAREEFPVLGMILLLNIAHAVNEVMLDGNLLNIPIVIAIVSSVFLTFPLILLLYVDEGILNSFGKLIITIFVLAVPVGSGGGEIFGRILNLGFYFPVYQVVTYLFFESKRNSVAAVLFVITNILSIATFPVTIVILLIFVCISYLFRKTDAFYKRMLFASLAPLFVAVLLLTNIQITSGGGGDTIVNDQMIEFVFGRMFIYPLVSGIYAALNNSLVILISIALTIAVGKLLKDVNRRLPLVITVLGIFFAYLTITLIFRTGLTYFLSDYASTFPDRYYYGLNICFVIALIVVATQTSSKVLELSVSFLIGINLILSLSNVYELNNPVQRWQDKGDLKAVLCKSPGLSINHNQKIVTLTSYPSTKDDLWKMTIPKEIYLENYKRNCTN